jgi:hypothetical protein
MKFILPKLNKPYRVLQDVEVELWHLDLASNKRLSKQGMLPYRGHFIITAGSVIKLVNFDYKRNKIKIRTVSLSDKRYEKLCGYVSMNKNPNWLDNLDVEEIAV